MYVTFHRTAPVKKMYKRATIIVRLFDGNIAVGREYVKKV